jgi:energy-coupling factor transport system permease protein
MRLAGTAIGQFYPGSSAFHRADPRSKIAGAFVFVLVTFLATNLTALVFMGLCLAAGISIARIPAAWIYRSLKPLFWLIIITFVFQLFLRGGEELARLGPIPVYRDGVYDGTFLGLRLLVLVASSTLLTFTTPPVLLADALGRMLSPLSRLRLPVYELSLMVTIAMRFIPTLLMELDRIIKAQRARGGSSRGGPVRRALDLMPVLVPLFVLSFRHADDLALAMESRCWRGGRGRSTRRRLRFGAVDAWLGAILAAVVVISLLIGRWQ